METEEDMVVSDLGSVRPLEGIEVPVLRELQSRALTSHPGLLLIHVFTDTKDPYPVLRPNLLNILLDV